MTSSNDITILRELAKRYAEIAALPVQEEKRRVWREHFSLKPTQVPILATYGMWNVWCKEVFADSQMQCTDEFYRGYERFFKMNIMQHEVVGDDMIQEPWIPLGATTVHHPAGIWGIEASMHGSGIAGEAAVYDGTLTSWDDIEKMCVPHHQIDEEQTAANFEKLSEAIGEILPIDLQRTPCCVGFNSDISTHITKFRGMQQLMLDMYESPDELHRLLAFMRDGILANNQEGEDAGDFSLTSGQNQACCYADELTSPIPNSGPRKRKDIWGFCAAQEYTLISPEFHDEFLFQYQLPIYEQYGLTHYGCCEDLGRKIDMLRQLKNLRSIAVTPVANVRQCAEQIGTDYAFSWRPNPTDMVCCGYDEEKITRIVTQALDDAQGCLMHIHLKDVETVEGDVTRLGRWVRLMRHLTDK